MAGAAIRIAILANGAQAKSELASTSQAASSFGKGLGKLGTVAKAGFAAAAIGAVALGAKVAGLVSESVSAASDLQQSSGAVEAVFGKSAAGITKVAQSAAQAFGLSQNAYQELATTLGAGLKNQGIKDFAGQTQDVIKLGSDLSAQFGGSTKDAVEAIGSLMRGEADPIERYGVSIKQSAINAELAAKGQSKLTGAAKTQAEAQARLSLLFKQTKDAQGAFGREGGTLANIQQKNAAAVENLKAKLGTSLLPVFTAAANLIATRVLPVLDRVVAWAGANLPGALASARAALAPILGAFTSLTSGAGGFSTYLAAVGPALIGVFNGVKAVVVAVLPIVQQVIGAVVSAVQANLPAIVSIYQSITSVLQSIGSILTSVWQAIGPIVIPIVTSIFGAIIGVISGAFNIIAGLFETISSLLRGDWQGMWQGIQQIGSGALGIVRALFTNIFNIANVLAGRLISVGLKIYSGVKGKFDALKGAVTSAITGMVAAVMGRIAAMASAVQSRVNAVKSFFASAWSAIRSGASSAFTSLVSIVASKISAVVAKVRALPGQARSALGAVGSALYSAGSNLIQGFINGIAGSIGGVIAKARQIASSAVSAVKGALGIHSPSRVFIQIGKYVGQGFAIGIRGTEAQVKSAVTRMVGLLTKEAKSKGVAGARARAALSVVNRLDNRALQLAKLRTAATAKLAAAQARLNDLVKQRADFAAGVRDSALTFAAITGIKDEDKPLTNSTLIQGLKERLAALANFRNKLNQLKAQGLNSATLQQIISAGVEGGTEIANTLATGGKSVIAQVNALQGQIGSQASALGNQTAAMFYNTGIQAQQGLIKGLTANQKALQSAANQIAATLSKAVKKALGIKSPSRVFAAIGDNVSKGLIVGLDNRATGRAGIVLAKSLVNGFGDPQLNSMALVGAGGAGSNTYEIKVYAHPTTSKSEIAKEVVDAIKELEKNTGRKYLVK